MRAEIETDELWPFFILSNIGTESTEWTTEVPDELVERYLANMVEFNAIQRQLRELKGWSN